MEKAGWVWRHARSIQCYQCLDVGHSLSNFAIETTMKDYVTKNQLYNSGLTR
jgi:hypothetical protein